MEIGRKEGWDGYPEIWSEASRTGGSSSPRS